MREWGNREREMRYTGTLSEREKRKRGTEKEKRDRKIDR